MDLPVSILTLDLNYKVVAANECFKSLFTSLDITGLDFVLDLVKMNHRTRVTDFMTKISNHALPSSCTFTCAITLLTKRDAFPRSFVVSVSVQFKDAHITAVLVSAHDAAVSSVSSCNASSDCELTLADVLDYIEEAPIALHWLSGTGHVLWTNRAHRELLGFTKQEIIGKHLSHFSTDTPEIMKNSFDIMSSGGTLRNHSTRWIAADGAVRNVIVDSNGHIDEDGKMKNTRCFIQDDTARHIQMARDQILTESIIEKQIAQDRFLRRVLHEIRTPCNVMMQMLESSRESGAAANLTATLTAADHRTMLFQIHKLNDMVKDAEDAATFESGKTLKQRLARFCVLDAMQNCFKDMMDETHEASEVSSTMEFASEIKDRMLPRIVMIDRKCICRVIRHLLNNARRLTRQGCIKFTVSVKPHKSDDENRCCLAFKVENTAAALDPVRVHDLFQNYYSMGSEDGEQKDGFFDFDECIGIELNICYNIVQAIGSKLEFSSSDDGVNSFWFELTPTVVEWISYETYIQQDEIEIELDHIQRICSMACNWVDVSASKLSAEHILDPNDSIERTSKSTVGCSRGESVPRRPHVLVTDDNIICQRVLCRTLQKLNCTTEVAANGQIACDMVVKHIFDLVFLDLRMPILNGLDACKKMVCELGVKIPIIGFSAEDSPVIHQECLSSGMSAFIVKPAKQERIKHILEQFCDF